MTTRQDLEFGAYVVAAVFIDGTAAFALGDGSVRLLTGRDERIVPVHNGAVLTATMAVSGKELLTGGDDGLVAAVVADGTVRTVASRPRKWIDQLAAAPNGAVAFATGRQAVVVGTDGAERTFDHARSVGGLAFAPKGYRLAVARYDGVTMWWAGTGADPVNLEWKGAHLGVMFAPDGKHVVTAMQENAMHGWRLADSLDMRMSGYPAKPRSLSWSYKGRYLASSGANAAVLWPFHHKDGPMGRQPLQLGAREPLVTQVACHPRQEMVAIGYRDGMVVLSRFEDTEDLTLREAGDAPVTALSWDTKGQRLVYGTEDGAAGLVDLNAGET
jgi:WD40 repeat protein